MLTYAKYFVLVVCSIYIYSCSEHSEHPKQNNREAYREGKVMHFLWKEKNDSHELIITAVKDTTYHSSALRILGYHRILGEIPCEINGIYSPDSGFRFTLYDSKYNENGEGHIYLSDHQEWTFELSNKNKKNIIPVEWKSSFKDINIKMLYEQDCEFAQKNKMTPEKITSPFDTSCSKSQIFYPEFERGNPLQPLVFNKDSFLLLPGKETYYRDLFGSFIPVFSNEKYISFYAQSYIFTGGAHGMPATELINIYKPNAHIIKFNEIIDTSNIKKLYSVCEPFFKDQVGEITEWNFVETGFYIPNQLVILKDGLVFHYDAYEIGAYAQGMPEFFVPWKVLKPFLKKGFVLP